MEQNTNQDIITQTTVSGNHHHYNGDFTPFDDDSIENSSQQKFPHTPVWTVAAALLALVLMGVLFIYLRFILVPLAISRAICYCLRPIVNLFSGKKTFPFTKRRLNLGNRGSVALTILLVCAIATAIGVLLFFSIRSMVADWDEYKDRAEELFEKFLEWVDVHGMNRSKIENAVEKFDGGGLVVSSLNTVLLILPGFFMVLLITLYMLTDYGTFSGEDAKNDLQRNVDARIRSYILIKVGISATTGVCVGIVLLILRVKMAIVFGILTFMLNFIPTIGSFIAIALPLPIVILDPDVGVVRIILTLVLPLCVQIVLGSIIEPRIAGKAMSMSSVAVLLSLSFWASVWGLPGAFMAVPLTVVCRLLLSASEHPAAILLERILAGDYRIGKLEKSSLV